MDVDTQDEELANLHIDLRTAQCDLASQGNLGRNIFASVHCCCNELFEKRGLVLVSVMLSSAAGATYLDALCQGMGNRQLRHVVGLVSQGDKIVVDTRLVLLGVVEVEMFRLNVIR